QIDAHLDWADHRSGQRYGHGSCIRRLSEMDHVKNIFQFGIRGISSSLKEDVDAARDYGATILSLKKMRDIGVKRILVLLPKGEKYYITINIKGLYPSITSSMDNTSSGGLLYVDVNE